MSENNETLVMFNIMYERNRNNKKANFLRQKNHQQPAQIKPRRDSSMFKAFPSNSLYVDYSYGEKKL